ncbi:MAG: hypothetical protein WC788_06270 [Candidatus Paceibacterota bacterium]
MRIKLKILAVFLLAGALLISGCVSDKGPETIAPKVAETAIKQPISENTGITDSNSLDDSKKIEGNTLNGITVKGLPVKEPLVGAYNNRSYENNVAYVQKYASFRSNGVVEVYFTVPKNKLQNIAIAVDDNLVLDNFKAEISGDNKILTVNSYLRDLQGVVKLTVESGNGGKWNRGGSVEGVKGPQRKSTVWMADKSANDELYRVNINIRFYQ